MGTRFGRSRAGVVATATFLSVFAGGCERTAAVPTVDTEVRDSAGVAIVHNRALPIEDRSGSEVGEDAWRVEPLYTVRGPDSPAEVEGLAGGGFGYVADVEIDHDTLFVLDAMAQTVHVVAPSGRLLRSIGAPGDGPGELSRFAATLLLRSDTVLVVDWGRGRVHRFEQSGAFIDAPLLFGDGARGWWRRGADGRIYARSLERYVDEESRWRGHDRLLVVPAARVEPDTVLTFDYPESDLGGPGRLALPLLVNAPSWDVLDDGSIVWTLLEDTRVRVLDADGELERLIGSEEWVRRAPGAAEREAWLRLMGDKLVALGGSRSTLGQLPAQHPELLPAITTVRAGPGASIWVQRMGAAEDVHPMALNSPDPPTGWGGSTWDVLDRSGHRVAVVDLGPRVRVTRLTADRVVGVRRDQLGVEEVIVWRLVR